MPRFTAAQIRFNIAAMICPQFPIAVNEDCPCRGFPAGICGSSTTSLAIAATAGDATSRSHQSANLDIGGKSCCNLPYNRIGRSTVRFATLEIEQIPGSPFVAWHA
ncbi:hypothetical protein ACQR09_02910 [Bradyrhizobium oligotrophicum]|uniref:hypothetical protein n=1 Tax=Bradyrhizobium oligotrophicum TaxID=44255 RepID=UPI003EB9E770